MQDPSNSSVGIKPLRFKKPQTKSSIKQAVVGAFTGSVSFSLTKKEQGGKAFQLRACSPPPKAEVTAFT